MSLNFVNEDNGWTAILRGEAKPEKIKLLIEEKARYDNAWLAAAKFIL